jgi:GT2 family glycosyltransferase/O-antigen ligase
MRDLRIVIVPWNSEKQLAACLSSLSAACEGLTWDVVVVDNASTDKSVAVARQYVGPNGVVIENKENRGFAKACNQGIAGFDTRFVLLLNPDTVCPPSSLTKLVRAADNDPQIGIAGPKLVNTDGSAQTSIRRFPSFWDQMGVMLKVHNFIPTLFSRYFAADKSLDAEQDVDSIMGACFLIRKELIKDIGILDERYFIWFEEVDYCRRAHQNGWKVRYIPSTSITHMGGQSFDQVFSVKKQSYFNTSLISYFRKWKPAWQGTVLSMIQPISIAFAWLASKLGMAGRGSRRVLVHTSSGHPERSAAQPKDNFRQGDLDSKLSLRSFLRNSVGMTLKWWIVAVLGIEIISALTIFHPTANTLACVAIGIAMVFISYRRPTLGLAAIVMELMIGSQGHLLQVGKGFISLRTVLFLGFLIGWGISYLRRGTLKEIVALFRNRWEWLAIGALCVYAFIRGLALNNAPIISDANAWVFALLILPVLDLASREGKRLLEDVIPVFIIAPLWLALKTLGFEYLYAHGIAVVDPPSAIHLWIRRTGTGEITPIGRIAHRIFMQSSIFVLPPLFFWIAKRFATHDKLLSQGKTQITIGDIWAFAASVVFVLGLSRSIWMGTAVGIAVLAVLRLWKGGKEAFTPMIQATIRFACIAILAFAATAIVKSFPLPDNSTMSFRPEAASRLTTSDPASNSRRNLLDAMMAKINEHPILGSGFGATVTYKSADPRVLALHPDGMYSTYAFEWGWLEHWIKFGIVGLFLMILLVCRLAMRIWHTSSEEWIKHSMLSSLIALCVIHIFTPYLNHPLGLGYLMMLEAWTVVTASTLSSHPSVQTTEL